MSFLKWFSGLFSKEEEDTGTPPIVMTDYVPTTAQIRYTCRHTINGIDVPCKPEYHTDDEGYIESTDDEIQEMFTQVAVGEVVGFYNFYD